METLLVGTDFSETARCAVDYAGSLAAFLGAKLLIVHGYSGHMSLPGASSPVADQALIKGQIMGLLENEQRRLIAFIGYDPGIEVHAREGSAADVIRHFCEEGATELVVAGTHGATADFGGRLLGNTAMGLSMDLPVPVLLIPRGTVYRPVKKITFACSYRFEEGATVVQFARAIAYTFGAVLEVLNISVGVGEREFIPNEAYAYVESKLKDTEHVTILLHNDDVTDSLLKYLKKNATDVLLLHPRRLALFNRLFNPGVTQGVLRHIQVPVLLVR